MESHCCFVAPKTRLFWGFRLVVGLSTHLRAVLLLQGPPAPSYPHSGPWRCLTLSTLFSSPVLAVDGKNEHSNLAMCWEQAGAGRAAGRTAHAKVFFLSCWIQTIAQQWRTCRITILCSRAGMQGVRQSSGTLIAAQILFFFWSFCRDSAVVRVAGFGRAVHSAVFFLPLPKSLVQPKGWGWLFVPLPLVAACQACKV